MVNSWELTFKALLTATTSNHIKPYKPYKLSKAPTNHLKQNQTKSNLLSAERQRRKIKF